MSNWPIGDARRPHWPESWSIRRPPRDETRVLVRGRTVLAVYAALREHGPTTADMLAPVTGCSRKTGRMTRKERSALARAARRARSYVAGLVLVAAYRIERAVWR